jgi:CP family cyanate transporter-like MFS transporter
VHLVAIRNSTPKSIVAWLLSVRSRPRDGGSTARRRRSGIWADPIAWQVLLYMGLQSSIFYMLVTWFAPIAHSLGRSEVVAGVDVMIFQLCAIAGSLTIPLLLRGRMQRVGPAAIPVLSLVGVLGLIAWPPAFLLWVILCGLASGASLGVSLSLFSLRSRDHEGASALSGMAQSGGYLIAAAGPIAFGALLSVSGGWLAPLVLVGLVLVGQLVVGVLVGRNRYVLEPR